MGRRDIPSNTNRIISLYNEIVKYSESVRTEGFTVKIDERLEKLIDEIKNEVIFSTLSKEDIDLANEWVRELRKALNELAKVLGISGVTLSKEVKSFIENPFQHLRKKLFIYTHDLVRKSMDLDTYLRTSMAAIRTSFRTNLRTIYQLWVLSSILLELSRYGSLRLIYPEYGYLSFDRSGKQKTGTIPPNAVVEVSSGRFLSIYIEAPRPIGWEDSSDLKRSWKLYTALRPDVMVYGGKVLNILNYNSNPPILRPDVIIECKELEDWYVRIRDVRGPFAKPLTAEEWRNKWIRGLWSGLSEVLGIEVGSVNEIIKERKGVRLREYQVVALYNRVYKPKTMYLISKYPVPTNIRKYLEDEGIKVVDNVGFNRDRLADVAKELITISRGSSEYLIKVDEDMKELIVKLASRLGITIEGRDLSNILREVLSKLINTLS